MKYKILALFLCLGILTPALAAYAATIRTGQDLSVDKTELVRGNLYIAGKTVAVSGVVDGDLVAAGGKIIVNGPVSADVLAAGGTVDLMGRVGSDVRIAGGEVTIGSDVISGDLVVTGGTVHVLSSTNIRSDLIVMGGTVIMDGKVDGNARVYGGTLAINGTIEGTLKAKASTKFALGPKALLKGDLEYTAPEELASTTGQILGKITFTDKGVPTKHGLEVAVASILGIFVLGKLLVIIVTVLILLFVLRRYVVTTVEETLMHFPRNAVVGFAALIAAPVFLVILAVTILGLPFAFMGFLSYGLLLVLSSLVAPIAMGALLSRWIAKETRVNWKWALLGVLVMTILSWIPIIGWIIPFVVFLATVGALLSIIYSRFWLTR